MPDWGLIHKDWIILYDTFHTKKLNCSLKFFDSKNCDNL